MWKTLITMFTLLSFTACTTLQTIQSTDASAVRQAVQAGDQVRIQTREGQVHDLTVQRVTESSIDGVGRDGHQQSVTLASIAKLEKQAAGDTNVWVVVGIVAAVGLVIALVAGDGDGNSGGGGGY